MNIQKTHLKIKNCDHVFRKMCQISIYFFRHEWNAEIIEKMTIHEIFDTEIKHS